MRVARTWRTCTTRLLKNSNRRSQIEEVEEEKDERARGMMRGDLFLPSLYIPASSVLTYTPLYPHVDYLHASIAPLNL